MIRPAPDLGHRWTGRYFHERYCSKCGLLYYTWAKRRLLVVCTYILTDTPEGGP